MNFYLNLITFLGTWVIKKVITCLKILKHYPMKLVIEIINIVSFFNLVLLLKSIRYPITD